MCFVPRLAAAADSEQAVPSGTTQLSSSQADKLSAWLVKGVEDISQTLLHSRTLFIWAAAACRVMPAGSPLADSTVSRLVLLATQTAAAYMKAAALMGRLETVGLDAFALCSSSQPSGSSSSETSGGSSSSSMAAVSAAAIDLLSLVALDFADHVECRTQSLTEYHRPQYQQRLQQQRKQGGGLVVVYPITPPPLLTVRRGEQKEPMPQDAWAVYADAGTRMALGHTLLTFYGLQLQQHLAQLQLQKQTLGSAEAHKQQPTAAAAAGCAAQNPPQVASSWDEAEGLLLLGADRLQGAAATDDRQQLAAVVAAWHRQLQQYRQALGYTEQQLAAAAALLAASAAQPMTTAAAMAAAAAALAAIL